MYILHTRLFFSPAANFYIFCPPGFFASKEGGKMDKKFTTLCFIYIIAPPTHNFSFFTKEGRKIKKLFSFLIFFPPQQHIFYFFFTSHLAGLILHNILPWTLSRHRFLNLEMLTKNILNNLKKLWKWTNPYIKLISVWV